MNNLNDFNNMNLSTKFQNEQLTDPINYNVSNRSVNQSSSAIPDRYALKSRQIKERDSLGGFKISQEHLKKHINPSDEYEAKLAALEERRNKLLELQQNANTNTDSSLAILQASQYFDPLLPANQSLIAMIDMQVNQLKQETEDYSKGLVSSKLTAIKEEETEVKEKDVATQFLSANPDRVQVIKHVQTQMKPEYMTLESIQKEKEANRLKLLELEKKWKEIKDNPMQEIIDDDCKRNPTHKPGITLDELNAILKHENELFHFEEKLKKQKKRKVSSSQQTNKSQKTFLNPKQEKYVKKLATYMIEKKAESISQKNENQLTDWNKTKIHSKNIAGVVDRKDGLPGHFDNHDLSFYYQNIADNNSGSFDGFMKGKQRRMRNSLNNSSISLNRSYTKFDNYNSRSRRESDLNISASQLNRNNFTIKNQSNIHQGNKELINMIYTLIDRNKIGLVEKESVISEMKFDDKTMQQLGFKSKSHFDALLTSYSTKLVGRIDQDEFTQFLSTKGKPKSKVKKKLSFEITANNQIKPDSDVASPPLFYESNNYVLEKKSTVSNKTDKMQEDVNINDNGDNDDDFLPGPHLRDILKNTSNVKRLQLLKEILPAEKQEEIQGKSMQRSKSNNKTQKERPKEVTYNDYKSVLNKFNQKEKINFTIPKPFDFEKKGSSERAMKRMKNLLEERQAEEYNIYVNQRFKAKNLKNEMFIGNIDKVIESDQKERQIRTAKLMDKIQDKMNPFSFVNKDQQKYHERVKKKDETPQYPQFKANQVNWLSKVAIIEGINAKEEKERKERIEIHAKKTLEKAKLPPRLEQHEKKKEAQKQQLKQIQKKQRQTRPQTAKVQQNQSNKLDVPDFNKLHKINEDNLNKKKKKVKPTVIEPFNLHETNKKIRLDYLNEIGTYDEDETPQFKQNIKSLISKIQKKSANEPSSTTGHKLLIEARRKEQEQKKKEEENRKLEDAQRKINNTRMKDRVQQSDALKDTKKKKYTNEFEQTQKNKENEMNRYLNIIKQKVTNKPLLFEEKSNVNTLVRRQKMQQLIQDAMEGDEDDDQENPNKEEEQEQEEEKDDNIINQSNNEIEDQNNDNNEEEINNNKENDNNDEANDNNDEANEEEQENNDEANEEEQENNNNDNDDDEANEEEQENNNNDDEANEEHNEQEENQDNNQDNYNEQEDIDYEEFQNNEEEEDNVNNGSRNNEEDY